MRTYFQKALLGTLLVAGYTIGYGATLLSQRTSLKPSSASKETSGIHLSQLLAFNDPQQQLEWLALHTDEVVNFEAALDALANGGLGSRERVFHELLTLWASRDPLAALAYANTLKGMMQYHAMEPLLAGWVEHDSRGVVEWLLQEGKKVNPLLRYHIIKATALRDPGLAFSLMRKLDSSYGIPYHDLFSIFGQSNPRAALLLLDQLPKTDRHHATLGLVSTWALYDPGAAASWVDSLSDPTARSQALQILVGSLVTSAPQDAARFVMDALATDAHTQGGDNLLRNFLYTWNGIDPAAVREWMSGLPARSRELAQKIYRESLASLQPQEFLRTLEEAKTVELSDRILIDSSLTTLASKSPQEALGWLKANAEWLPKSMFPGLVSTVLGEAPELSPQLLPLLVKGAYSNSAYRQSGQMWSKAEPEKAAAFFNSLPPGEERDAFERGLFYTTVTSDINQAYALLEGVPEGPQRNDLLKSLASETRTHRATAEWIASHDGSSSGGAQALSTLIRQWAQEAPGEAEAWLQERPADASNEALVSAYSLAIVQREPDSAILWAASISDEKRRESLMERLADEWLKADRKAAQEWIREAPFTDEIKERLLR